jgi:hypothetical protein
MEADLAAPAPPADARPAPTPASFRWVAYVDLVAAALLLLGGLSGLLARPAGVGPSSPGLALAESALSAVVGTLLLATGALVLRGRAPLALVAGACVGGLLLGLWRAAGAPFLGLAFAAVFGYVLWRVTRPDAKTAFA